MSRTVNVNLDDRSEQALRVVRGERLGEDEAIQIALQEAAERRGSADFPRYREQALKDAVRLADDLDDRAHMREIADQMAALAPDWSE